MFEVVGKTFKYKMGIRPKKGIDTTIMRRPDFEKRVGFAVDWANMTFIDASSKLPFFPAGGGNPTPRYSNYIVKGVTDWFVYFNPERK